MPQRFKSQILQHLGHRSYQPREIRHLADELGVAADDRDAFSAALEQLLDSGQVVLGASDVVLLPPIGREVTGRFKLNDRGFGFVIPDTRNSHGDLFVPAGKTAGGLTGDRVRAEVRRERGRPVGRIVEIIQRQNTRFVGHLVKRNKTWTVEVDGKALADPVIVRDPGAKFAHTGTKVVVELTRFPEGNALPEGVIVEVLGEQGKPDVETVGICRAYNLPDQFPSEVVDQARQIVQDYQGRRQKEFFKDRLDLRDAFVLTIDPPDAQDYDDALSITPTDDGWELGVHIADVASFVAPESPLDKEAYQRGNSAYLPRKVVPMLPEVLSNGICSLQPGVPRLTKSVFITYDRQGKPRQHRFANAIIESNHRMTYLEAQAVIDGNLKEAAKHAKADNDYTQELRDTLAQMDLLSKTIRKRRLKEGMIVLDLPEVELIYDEHGHVIDAQPEDNAYTHKLIEAFMVEANEAVARTFSDLNVPLIRRIHPDPGSADLSELRMFARVAGFNIPANPSRKELQELLELTHGKPAAKAVHLAVLKTLTKAVYDPEPIGHFALASEHYTHFTSPIRRYPDLSVHRALQALFEIQGSEGFLPKGAEKRRRLGRQLMRDDKVPDHAELAELGHHCSATERNAEAAERELRDLLVLQLLEKHVGDEFPGTCTGVTSFGIFIQIDKYLVEGMIRPDNLPGAPRDQWKLNDKTGSMTAQRSGRTIAIGDQFTVQISKVDLARREMDLIIIEEPQKTRTRKPKGKGVTGTKKKSVKRPRRSGRRGPR